MSAWIVGSDHLDMLLTAAVDWNLLDPEEADATGRMLWRENLASVAYRYPDDIDGDRPGPLSFKDSDVDTYEFRNYPGRVDPQVVEFAALSLRYQSCEHPGWPSSQASAFVARLHTAAADRIDAYVTEHGPINPDRQPAGQYGWYHVVDLQGRSELGCSDGWDPPDRGVFLRAAALRTPPRSHTAPR
jgi:hypothetical protein